MRLTLQFDASLPITEHIEEIVSLLSSHQVVVVAGETGSGKSTQLPKICLQAGLGESGIIAHTQPRRIAARTVAARIAEELNLPLGDLVGYQVRFHDKCSENTRIKLMTDGVLLAEIQRDRLLTQYSVIILDEAHERSLNIDFLLGFLKTLLPKRPDLKVIVTSATIDHERFAKFFGHAPVVTVSGRTYPVDLVYQPLETLEGDKKPLDMAVREAISFLFAKRGPGDILMFLSTEREIHELAEDLKNFDKRVTILKLFARLSLVQQQAIFYPKTAGPRLILATNVAETSVTVPRIKYVIDTGNARISRYSYKSKVQALPIESVSQASANQRAGRCGRLSPGICVRLYSEEDFNARPFFTDPEILRTNLAGIILQMKVSKLGNVEAFPFIDKPPLKTIQDGYKTLFEVGALDEARKLTSIGRQMAFMPLDPKLARILLAGHERKVLYDVLVIVAALSIQDPKERPFEQQQKADEAHLRWRQPSSDFLSWLILWEQARFEHQQLSHRKFRKWCQEQFLNVNRMLEWFDLFTQLKQLCIEKNWPVSRQASWYLQIQEEGTEKSSPSEPIYRMIHQALLTGLLSLVGMKDEKNRYQGARGVIFDLFPGSTLRKSKESSTPKWVMGFELMETSKRFLRQAASIEVSWLENLAKHLVKKTYRDPHWVARQGGVYAFEQVTLYGLIIVPKRSVYFGRIDAQRAHEVFITDVLAQGLHEEQLSFVKTNQGLLNRLSVLEDKLRRKDILIDEARLIDFYRRNVPVHVNSIKAAQTWWKGLSPSDQQKILLTKEQALLTQPDEVQISHDFPDSLTMGELTFPLSYCFDLLAEDDGVSVKVPLSALMQLLEKQLTYLVPGLLLEKTIFLIKSLPKNIRRQCVPAPDVAHEVLKVLRTQQVDKSAVSFETFLLTQLEKRLGRRLAQDLEQSDWQTVTLPDYLSMNIKVIDNQGKILDQSRNLKCLQTKWRDKAQAMIADLVSFEDTTIYRAWQFGELPIRQETCQLGVQLNAYLALQAVGHSGVKIVPLADKEMAQKHHKQGIKVLLELSLQAVFTRLDKRIAHFSELTLLYAPFGSKSQLERALIDLVLEKVFFTDTQVQPWEIRGPTQYDKLLSIKEAVPQVLVELSENIRVLLKLVSEVRKALNTKNLSFQWVVSLKDLKNQYSQLFEANFLKHTPLKWLPRLPIYLKGMLMRFERLQQDFRKDQLAMRALMPFENQLNASYPKLSEHELFWLLQEYRLSLFAQPIKTSVAISEARLQKILKGD